MARTRALSAALLLLFPGRMALQAAPAADSATVPQCPGIRLTASYLAFATPSEGPGFRFVLENRTAHAVTLAEPVPSSAHWYARAGTRWLWRASTGSGGSLVNALDERGRMFAYRPRRGGETPSYLHVPAHSTREWVQSMQRYPAIAYRPGCEQCNYPGERQYRAVFAYAYLPATGRTSPPGLLRCGIRSEPVVMPPLSR